MWGDAFKIGDVVKYNCDTHYYSHGELGVIISTGHHGDLDVLWESGGVRRLQWTDVAHPGPERKDGD
jgi:hypothetical protein